MKGDFSRNTFQPTKQFLRVLQQQGRVQVDADWNEQIAIFWDYLHTLAADLIGPFAGPVDDSVRGFDIDAVDGSDFTISKGRYYVNGYLCRNMPQDKIGVWLDSVSYLEQPHYPFLDDDDKKLPSAPYLVYLDVWERHLTHLEDDSIREKALGGPDTATRGQVIWQVKTRGLNAGQDCETVKTNWDAWTSAWQPVTTGCLKARTTPQTGSHDPCVIAPDSQYRGLENQLYRVEIHKPGAGGKAVFKWSRNNGAVVFPIQHASGAEVTLANLGRDDCITLNEGDCVEVVDDHNELRYEQVPKPLLKVTKVDRAERRVTLENDIGMVYRSNDDRNPLLRRWEGKGVIPESVSTDTWLELENDIELQFCGLTPEEEAAGTVPPYYQKGDYWLIPARVATGKIEWPCFLDGENKWQPAKQDPYRIMHYFAPLAVVPLQTNGSWNVEDCRQKFGPNLV